MEKIENWNEIESKEMGEFESLALGGHICVIMGAEEYTSPISGNTSFKVSVDIAKGDKQEEYFSKQYKSDTRQDKKWSNSAIKYLSLKEESLGFFKGFISAVEKSNAGYKWDFDETKLKGKKIACQFGLEEYSKQDGTTGIATKLTQFRSVDKIDEIKIPKVKLLDGTFVDYDDYMEKKDNIVSQAKELFGDSVVIDGDLELPF